MEVEHSRLLKFFTKGRLKSEMAEVPTIKIQKDFQNPPNVEAEVPGTHKIRETEHITDNQDGTDMTTSEVQITGADFTLSPVITVTKKESTLSRGGMKQQKVTVTEDIAMDETENGGFRITRAEFQSSLETSRESSSKTVATSERRERTIKKQRVDKDDKSHDEKKSKIPIMRLKQAVEKVQRERQSQKTRVPRRSSIPKLKDTKTSIKRDTSLQYHPKLEDEFDKLYEEMVINTQEDIDDKVLAVKIEDPEKVESKFEEIIHSYDEDTNEKQIVSRVSKIPALRRRDDDGSSKIGALIDRVKAKNRVTETELKDGGFKVTASTIRTKRFSRGNSRDLSRQDQKVEVTETIDIKESENNEVFVSETVKRTPVKPARSIRHIRKEFSKDGQKVDIVETIEGSEYGDDEKTVKETTVRENIRVSYPVETRRIPHAYGEEVEVDAKNMNVIQRFDNKGNSETVTVEKFNDGGSRSFTTTTTVRESVKVGTPVITETIIRNISREMSTESQNVDIVKDNESDNRGIVTIEEISYGDNKKFNKEKFVRENVKLGIPVRTERFTRGISREMGNFKQKSNHEIVTVDEVKDDSGQKVTKKTITRESAKVGIPVKTERNASNFSQEMKNNDQNIINRGITTTEETKNGGGQQIVKKTLVKETFEERVSSQIDDDYNKEIMKRFDNKDGIQEETIINEKVHIKSGIPTFTKVTQSYSKGRIQNVGMSKTIEWKPADEITRKYDRSVSEKVTKKELKGFNSGKFEASVDIREITDATDASDESIVGKDGITSIKDNIPKDPALERKIIDTVKDISSQITTKNVTEYESTEQVTNLEKNTYTLSKSVDLAVDRDITREPREIRKQISMRDIKEPIFKQESINKKYFTEINKESIKTDTVTEKRETEYSNTTKQEKGSDTEEVTILKGNVSRLKYKICSKDNVGVTKKETNESFPIKESILSRIAVYERTVPIIPVIKPAGGKISAAIEKEINVQEKPKIVHELLKDKTEDSYANDNKDEIEINYKEVTNKNEPFEFANIVKVQKDDSQFELPKILPDKSDYETEFSKTRPGKIDLNIWKNQVEVNKTRVNKIDVVRLENLDEIVKTLPGKVDFKTYESQFQVSKALPENIDINENENQIQDAELLPAKIDFEIKESPFAVTKTLTGNYYETSNVQNEVDIIEIQLDEIQSKFGKPGNIVIENNENHIEAITTLPGKIDFTNNANQIDLPKILPDKKDYLKPGTTYMKSSENEVETMKPIPGKLNLNLWKNQVEANKNLVGKVGIKKTEAQIANASPGKIDFNTFDDQVEVSKPGKIDLTTTDTNFEAIRTLPGTIDFITTENHVASKTVKGEMSFKTEVNQAEVHKTLPGIINFETFESQVEESKPVPGTIDFSATENQTDVVSSLPGEIDFITDKKGVNVPKGLPGKLDLTAWGNQVEVNKTLLKTTRYKTKQFHSVKTSGKDFITYENQVETLKTRPGKIDINEYENKTLPANKYDFLDKIDFKSSENKVEISSVTEPIESLSDPELVDELPIEVKENKQTIIGNIKRKMYFITNKNIIKNSANEPTQTEIGASDSQESDYQRKVDQLQTKTYSINDYNKDQSTMNESTTVEHMETTVSRTTENFNENRMENMETKAFSDYERSVSKEYELNTQVNIAQSKSNSEIKTSEHNYFDKDVTIDAIENDFNFDTNIVQNGLTRSEYGLDNFKTSREEMKRTKSLAELDLGDSIQGQVRRMVGRIKSVDFERRESVRIEKISIKEMPKKMSVLEKIALFEGKATSSNLKTTTLRTETAKNNSTQVISEETYLKKIMDLTSAKSRLGRMGNMLNLPLGNGIEMPAIALGTALMDNRLLPHLIGAAIDLGYHAIDTAYIYGNEKEIGQAIRAKIDDGTVKREDLFIMSKLWSTFHRPDLVEEACRNSLKNMGLEYFDLYMIHNPMSFKEGSDPIPRVATVLQYSEYDYLDAWFGMEKLVTLGLVKRIGVSNFNSQQIQKILDKGTVKPVVNQVECHPYLSQQRLHTYCAERGIILSCFGVLGSKGTPAEFKSSVPPVIDDALVQVIAAGLNVSPAQLLIRYQIECGHNVVVKSSSAAHLWDNLQALTFTLDKSQVETLHALNRNKRIFTFQGMGDTHRNYPFLAGY